jgi:uncharacterized membrane protein YphA (DoxX/SURF4 family)
MEKFIKAGRVFYALALLVYGIQQFIFGTFRPVFLPAWQSHLPGLAVWAYAFGIVLIAAGLAIIFEKKVRETALLLGGLLLFLALFVHIPFEIIADPYSGHVGVWTAALKELALSGGAFILAGTFRNEKGGSALNNFLEKLIPYGRIFFSITMIVFGIQHFVYGDIVAAMIPAYFAFPLYLGYVTGFALIVAGLAIMFNIKTKQVAILLASAIFLWFILLHIPRAIADPSGNRGNELASTFDALAFTGIALMIAFGSKK